MKLKYIVLLLILPLLFSNCKKDITDSIDITSSIWILKSNTSGSEMKSDDIYKLEFFNDSLFHLHLSVNEAGGKYSIATLGNIDVASFQPFSEACCENEFDTELITAFLNVTTYQVKGNTLTFYNPTGKIKFKKE